MVTTLPSTELEGTVCDNVVNKKETLLHIISPVSLMPGSYIPITQFTQSSTQHLRGQSGEAGEAGEAPRLLSALRYLDRTKTGHRSLGVPEPDEKAFGRKTMILETKQGVNNTLHCIADFNI